MIVSWRFLIFLGEFGRLWGFSKKEGRSDGSSHLMLVCPFNRDSLESILRRYSTAVECREA